MATHTDSNRTAHLFDRPRNVRRVRWGLYSLCVLALVLDFVVHRHVSHPWERLPEFYPLYGFAGCVVLVLAARGLRRLVMRPPDYYERAAGEFGTDD